MIHSKEREAARASREKEEIQLDRWTHHVHTGINACCSFIKKIKCTVDLLRKEKNNSRENLSSTSVKIKAKCDIN
jgi:hypothetical protein